MEARRCSCKLSDCYWREPSSLVYATPAHLTPRSLASGFPDSLQGCLYEGLREVVPRILQGLPGMARAQG